MNNVSRFLTVFLLTGAVVFAGNDANAQSEPNSTFEEVIPPGNNYDKAQFRLWIPSGVIKVRAILVLTTGSNGDGRPMIDDPVWKELATQHQLALVGCQITDKPHEQNFIEQYANASQGSGQAMLTALARLAMRSSHPELADAPLLLWGMSAGGEFNYEFVAWKPERVLAFVANKGGIYYTALASQAARSVPGILFIGGSDLEFRTNTLKGLFAVNRRAGALWALAEEPGAGHVVGRSKEMGAILFAEVLGGRLSDSGEIRSLSEKTGFIGDLKTLTFTPAAGVSAPSVPTAWLPTLRVARAWQALVTAKPFDP